MAVFAHILRIKHKLRPWTRAKEAYRWGVRYWGGWLILHDWWIDRQFGASCGGVVASPFADLGATRTESCSYRVLARLFRHPSLRIEPSDVLVDVGCGKGRVLNFWLHNGVRNPIVGIELTPAVGAFVRERLSTHPNVRIVIGDATRDVPPDGTVFFLFNPFGRDTMRAFAERILANASGRTLKIVYLNARHTDVFDRRVWHQAELDSGSPDRAVLITNVASGRD